MRWFLCLCLLWAFTGVYSSPVNQTSELRLVSDIYCPLTCEAGSGHEGYLVDLAREATADSHHTLNYLVYPWERALLLVRQGQADGVLGVSERRSSGLLRSSPVGFDVTSLSILAPVSVPEEGATDFKWLDRYRLAAAISPLNADNEFERYLTRRRSAPAGGIIKVSGENASQLLVRMLVAGRVDGILEHPQVVQHAFHREFPDVRFWQQALTQPRPLYIAVRDTPANAAWLVAFEAGLENMRQDGRLAALMARYGLVDWQDGGVVVD